MYLDDATEGPPVRAIQKNERVRTKLPYIGAQTYERLKDG